MHDKVFGLNLIRCLLCGLLLVQIGCATATGGGADVGTIVNANKQLEKTVDVSALAAYKATVAAIRELNMSITGEYRDGKSVEMKSKFPDSEIAWVEITSISAVSCKVIVRVGVFADESRSRSLLTTIMKNLPNESTASEIQPVNDKLKQSEDVSAGTLQQPVKSEEDKSAVDTQAERLKPMPQEIVTEKSLL
jgi:hypothetical protein